MQRSMRQAPAVQSSVREHTQAERMHGVGIELTHCCVMRPLCSHLHQLLVVVRNLALSALHLPPRTGGASLRSLAGQRELRGVV